MPSLPLPFAPDAGSAMQPSSAHSVRERLRGNAAPSRGTNRWLCRNHGVAGRYSPHPAAPAPARDSLARLRESAPVCAKIRHRRLHCAAFRRDQTISEQRSPVWWLEANPAAASPLFPGQTGRELPPTPTEWQAWRLQSPRSAVRDMRPQLPDIACHAPADQPGSCGLRSWAV